VKKRDTVLVTFLLIYYSIVPNMANCFLQTMFQNCFTSGEKSNRHQVIGTVVLMKKSVLDFNNFTASMLDGLHELVGKGVSLQLISAVNTDQG
jgi:hypothetical protein